MITKTIIYKSFRQFQDAILPTGVVNDDFLGFAFRGESSSIWPLLPKALRPDKRDELLKFARIIIGLKDSEYESRYETEHFQVKIEFAALQHFYIMANENGLKLPNSEIFKSTSLNAQAFMFISNLEINTWLPLDLIEIAALAQHHKIPTRMLDFSFSIFTALYFASLGALRSGDTEGNIVIWALDYRSLNFEKSIHDEIPIRFSVPQYSDNPNLNAQKGLFVYWQTDNPFNENIPVNRTPFDARIREYERTNTLLYRFELPKKECTTIFSYLVRLGYTGAKLFPGYDGVVKAMRDEEFVKHYQPPTRS
jgi:hypothetical protein